VFPFDSSVFNVGRLLLVNFEVLVIRSFGVFLLQPQFMISQFLLLSLSLPMQLRDFMLFILFDSVVHSRIEILVEFVVLILVLICSRFLLCYVRLVSILHLLLFVFLRILDELVILYCILEVISVFR